MFLPTTKLRDMKRTRIRSEGNVASCGGHHYSLTQGMNEKKYAHAPKYYLSQAYSACIEQGSRKMNV